MTVISIPSPHIVVGIIVRYFNKGEEYGYWDHHHHHHISLLQTWI